MMLRMVRWAPAALAAPHPTCCLACTGIGNTPLKSTAMSLRPLCKSRGPRPKALCILHAPSIKRAHSPGPEPTPSTQKTFPSHAQFAPKDTQKQSYEDVPCVQGKLPYFCLGFLTAEWRIVIMTLSGKMGRFSVGMCANHCIVCGKLVSLVQWSHCESTGSPLTDTYAPPGLSSSAD